MLKKILYSAVLVLVFAARTMAAHPLVGDDTTTHGWGKYQLELNSEAGYDRQKQAGVETRTSARQAAAIITAGLGERVDIVFGVPWQWIREKENGSLTASASGIGDVSLEMKWRFFEKDGLSLAVKPGATLPSGDEERGLGTGRISGGVTMIATKELAPITVHLNASYFRNEYSLESDRQTNRNDIYRTSLSALYEVARNLQLVAETCLESNSDRSSRTWPAFATVGAIYSLNEALDLDLGIKRGLNDPATDLTLLAGVSVHF